MSKTQAHVQRIHRRSSVVFDCDSCLEAIPDTRFLRLLRPKYALPEDPTVLKLHKKCVHKFLASHQGWDEYSLKSPEAKWLFPLRE